MDNQTLKSMFLQEFQHRYSAATHKSYNLSLNQFFAFHDKPFDRVKPRDIRGWLASLEDNGLLPRTINTKLAALKSFYQYCMEENMLNKNPTQTVRPPQKEDSIPYYLDKKQLALLQEYVRGDVRDRAIIEMLYATGVRIGELLNIRLQDIKWDTRQVWIREGKGNKERFVLFTHECAERLKAYLAVRKNSTDFLFPNGRGSHLSHVAVRFKFQEYSEALGFKVTPHTLRHTFAAHLAEKGMNQSFIQELLGHININSTRIYTQLVQSARKKQYDQYQ